MNKKGMILRVVIVLFMITLFTVTPVFADIPVQFPSSSDSIGEIDDSVRKVWGTVITIVQILAFAAVVFAGLRYMFASADQKADIKKGLGMLTVGAILVFASATVIQFVVDAAGEVVNP